MTDPTPDLSRLTIRRDDPSPAARRAFRLTALLAVIAAVFLWVLSLAAFAYPRLRNVEDEVPDAIEDDEPEAAPRLVEQLVAAD